MIKQILFIGTLVIMLAACDGGAKLVKTLTTQLGAATENPCSDNLDFQQELNGIADDTRLSSKLLDGVTVYTEQHWYADLETIIFYAYEEKGNWCNVWNEGGVSWVN